MHVMISKLQLQKDMITYNTGDNSTRDYGRTWITDTMTVDQLYLYNGAHLALTAGTITFTTEGFYGDGFVTDATKLGTIHVGLDQTFIIR